MYDSKSIYWVNKDSLPGYPMIDILHGAHCPTIDLFMPLFNLLKPLQLIYMMSKKQFTSSCVANKSFTRCQTIDLLGAPQLIYSQIDLLPAQCLFTRDPQLTYKVLKNCFSCCPMIDFFILIVERLNW